MGHIYSLYEEATEDESLADFNVPITAEILHPSQNNDQASHLSLGPALGSARVFTIRYVLKRICRNSLRCLVKII